MDLSEILSNGQTKSKPVERRPKGYSTVPTHSYARPADSNSDSDAAEEESHESDASILDDSETEEDDGQLENLAAFVDSIATKRKGLLLEPGPADVKKDAEGYHLLDMT